MYSVLAGLSVPTQRTLIMLCIYFVARWCRRQLAVDARARPGADRRAADRSVCAARGRRVAVVRRGRDHPAGSRGPRAARWSDRERSRAFRSRSRSGSCRCCSRAFGSISLISPLANVARGAAVHAAGRAHGAARDACGRRSVWLPAANGCSRVPAAVLQWTLAAAANGSASRPLALWHSAAAAVARVRRADRRRAAAGRCRASGRRAWRACCCACRSLLHRPPVPACR